MAATEPFPEEPVTYMVFTFSWGLPRAAKTLRKFSFLKLVGMRVVKSSSSSQAFFLKLLDETTQEKLTEKLQKKISVVKIRMRHSQNFAVQNKIIIG